MNYPEWKKGSNYNTGDIVIHRGILYRTNKPLLQSELEPSINQPKNFFWTVVSEDCQSNNEAEKLLAEVCKQIENYGGHARSLMLNQITGYPTVVGLKEWWDTHKPKTEREQKLDKVANTINEWRIDGNEDDTDTDNKRLAEQILTLLGL